MTTAAPIDVDAILANLQYGIRVSGTQIRNARTAFTELVDAGRHAQAVLADRWFVGDSQNDDKVIDADRRLKAALCRVGAAP